jgi:MFS transporter, FHS family, L-fucose permease
VLSLVGISGCMSLMFPTIYGLAVRGLGEDTKIGGSGLIMAILGGAVITAIQGQVSDMTGSINLSYLVPLGCFVVIAYYAVSKSGEDLGKEVEASLNKAARNPSTPSTARWTGSLSGVTSR